MSAKDMTAAEFSVYRALMGLTRAELTTILDVSPRTFRAWETGRDTIPSTVAAEVWDLAADHDALAHGMVRDQSVVIPRQGTVHAGRPAGWWTAAAAQALARQPALEVEYLDDPAPASSSDTQAPLIESHRLPTTAQLAEMLRFSEQWLADAVLEAEDLHLRFVPAEDYTSSLTQGASFTEESIVVAAEWTQHSRTRGTMRRGATVIQVVRSGLRDGEGWAYVRQWVSRQALSETAASAAVAMIVNNALPGHSWSREL